MELKKIPGCSAITQVQDAVFVFKLQWDWFPTVKAGPRNWPLRPSSTCHAAFRFRFYANTELTRLKIPFKDQNKLFFFNS